MAESITTRGVQIDERDTNHHGNLDAVESIIHQWDSSVKESTGVSLFHILTIGSIAASIALYASGRKSLGIFVGLWPPTFEALKAVADKHEKSRR